MSRISLQSIIGTAEFTKFGVGGTLIPKTKDEFDRCAEMAQRLLEIVRNARASQ